MNSETYDHALEPYSDDEALEIENTLWWLQGRKAFIRYYLQTARQFLDITTIMDIGCGSGGNLDVLSEFGKVIGVERSAVLAQRARARGIASAIIEKDASEIHEIRGVQLFTMFDVLEHIEHDAEFLKKLGSSAPQKHLLLISVPASPFLYGPHDKILHHYRRYTKRTLQNCLQAGNYRTLKLNYFLFFLFPVAIWDRFRDKLLASLGKERTEINLGEVRPTLSKVLSNILKLEASVAQRIPFPTGLWLFALAEKQD